MSPSAPGKDGEKRMMFFKPCSQVLNVPSIWLLPAEVWIKFWFPMWSCQMVGSELITSLQQNSLDTDSNHKICWKLESRVIQTADTHAKDPSPYSFCQLFKNGFSAENLLKPFKAVTKIHSHSQPASSHSERSCGFFWTLIAKLHPRIISHAPKGMLGSSSTGQQITFQYYFIVCGPLQWVLEFVGSGTSNHITPCLLQKSWECWVNPWPGETVKGALERTLFSKANRNLGRRLCWRESYAWEIWLCSVTTRGQGISFPLHLKSNISKSLELGYYFSWDCSVQKFHL